MQRSACKPKEVSIRIRCVPFDECFGLVFAVNYTRNGDGRCLRKRRRLRENQETPYKKQRPHSLLLPVLIIKAGFGFPRVIQQE
jgi:hypothetical protein